MCKAKCLASTRRFFMKKFYLSLMSILLVLAMLFSLSGCATADVVSESGSVSSDTVSGSGDGSEQSKESETKKPAQESAKKEESESDKKTTAKQEETLVPGKTLAKETLTKKTYDLSQAQTGIRLIGRSHKVHDGISFDHSASGIEFHGYMTGDLKLTVNSWRDTTYYTVFVDGKRVDSRLSSLGDAVVLNIASFTGNYYHTVKILKQSEEVWTLTTLRKLEMTGYLLKAPEARKYHIEVLGDSLTTGYGNLGNSSIGNAQGGNTPLMQDATQSYGFLAAEALNADCSIVAWSGVGLDVSYTGTSFGDYYKKQAMHRSNDELYTYKRAPDVLVIHLGANDSTNSRTTRAGFVAKGKALINDIRKGYGKDMPIIWAYDPDEGVPDYIKEVLDSFGGESAGLYILELEWHSTGAYWGASGHPSKLAHQKHSELLVDLIKKKNLLK